MRRTVKYLFFSVTIDMMFSRIIGVENFFRGALRATNKIQSSRCLLNNAFIRYTRVRDRSMDSRDQACDENRTLDGMFFIVKCGKVEFCVYEKDNINRSRRVVSAVARDKAYHIDSIIIVIFVTIRKNKRDRECDMSYAYFIGVLYKAN